MFISPCGVKPKLIQRRAYGYRNFQNYRLRALMVLLQ
ncbi:MAG: transposase [Akkermansia sp.]|nr:transposase [Akkermansia sp.]